jgi:hypothetical protein
VECQPERAERIAVLPLRASLSHLAESVSAKREAGAYVGDINTAAVTSDAENPPGVERMVRECRGKCHVLACGRSESSVQSVLSLSSRDRDRGLLSSNARFTRGRVISRLKNDNAPCRIAAVLVRRPALREKR